MRSGYVERVSLWDGVDGCECPLPLTPVSRHFCLGDLRDLAIALSLVWRQSTDQSILIPPHYPTGSPSLLDHSTASLDLYSTIIYRNNPSSTIIVSTSYDGSGPLHRLS